MAVSGQKLPDATVRTILRLLRAGQSYRQIASTLGISTTTIQRVKKEHIAK